jgi:cytochrome b subunit of formate dehydrogenase
MTEVIEISRGSYVAMCFFIGLLTGFLLCPFFMWLAKMLKEVLEK